VLSPWNRLRNRTEKRREEGEGEDMAGKARGGEGEQILFVLHLRTKERVGVCDYIALLGAAIKGVYRYVCSGGGQQHLSNLGLHPPTQTSCSSTTA
jgi:hypothetical protein